METTTIADDIKVLYVTATSFPEGIMDAHSRLHALVPFSLHRKYFGISRPENNGEIIYRAATEETFDGKAKQFNCETLVLKKGDYLSITLHNYMKDLQSIGQAFQQLLSQPNLDPEGYCVEWYNNNRESVACMIRLNSNL